MCYSSSFKAGDKVIRLLPHQQICFKLVLLNWCWLHPTSLEGYIVHFLIYCFTTCSRRRENRKSGRQVESETGWCIWGFLSRVSFSFFFLSLWARALLNVESVAETERQQEQGAPYQWPAVSAEGRKSTTRATLEIRQRAEEVKRHQICFRHHFQLSRKRFSVRLKTITMPVCTSILEGWTSLKSTG